MQMALPALSELRTSAPRERLFEVSRSMAQVMLLLSGGIVAVVVAVNGPFVAWWVGESRFAGTGITALLLTGMLLRHLNATATYTLFCFGNERRLALTSIADGLASVTAMLILVPVVGLYGAAIGPLVGTCLVSLPNNFRALAREEGASPLSFFSHLSPWIARLAAILIVAVAGASLWKAQGVPNIVALALGISVLYGTTMLPVLTTPPLGTMLNARIGPYLAFVPAFLRRDFARQAID
jgi:O-antigen/teichoic acid export membrane protein